MTQPNYIEALRQSMGPNPIILNFAGGLLFNAAGEVLLQKRSDFSGWGLPGGALEFGETNQMACIREFKEETGLDVRIKSLLGVLSANIQTYPNRDVAQTILTVFQVESVTGSLNADNKETQALAYFALNHLPQIFNNQHQMIIDYYRKGQIPFYD